MGVGVAGAIADARRAPQATVASPLMAMMRLPSSNSLGDSGTDAPAAVAMTPFACSYALPAESAVKLSTRPAPALEGPAPGTTRSAHLDPGVGAANLPSRRCYNLRRSHHGVREAER